MKKVIFLFLIISIFTINAIAGTTFSSKEVLTATKLNQAFGEKHDVVSFNNYSTQMKSKLDLKQNKSDIDSWVTKVSDKPDINPNTITIPQKTTPQYVELLEGSAGGTNKVTITVPATLTADHSLTITDSGLMFDGSLVSSSGGTWGSITGTLSSQTDLITALNLKELASNKSTTTTLGTSNTLYPSQNAVKTYVDTQIAGVSIGVPITNVPTYSNDTCTKGQYAPTTSYLYFCKDTNTWDRIAFTSWSNLPAAAPTFSSFTIGTSGTSLTAAMSESTTVGSGGSGGLALSCTTGGTLSATYSSGSGSSSLVYTIPTVYSGDTCTASYTNPTNGLEGSTGTDVATVSGVSVTNSSTATQQVSSEIIQPTGTIGGWNKSGSATNAITLTDSDDATYFYYSGTSTNLYMNMTEPVSSSTITSVKFCARISWNTAQTKPTPRFRVFNTGTSTYGSFTPDPFVLLDSGSGGGNFNDYCTNAMTVNPITSATWTKSDITSLAWYLNSGVQGPMTINASKVWAEVNY